MDAIKKKMQSLKTETENAMARADQLDAEFRAATSLAEKTEESVGFPSIKDQRPVHCSGQPQYILRLKRLYQGKIQALEIDLKNS